MIAMASRLRAHVQLLAEDIGERNVFRPKALHAAADYIDQQFHVHGYDVARQVVPSERRRIGELAGHSKW